VLKEIIVNTGVSKSSIYVGCRWESVENMLPIKNVVIVTDHNIYGLYGDRFPDFPVLKQNPVRKPNSLRPSVCLQKSC